LSRLQEENNKLRNELENFRNLEQEMEKINKIRKELIIFKNIADSDNINLDDLAKSVDNAVAKMFGIKKSGLKEQSSKILSMILSIYENEAKWNLPKEKI
jgi:DNA anti-recombination protein RmuC